MERVVNGQIQWIIDNFGGTEHNSLFDEDYDPSPDDIFKNINLASEYLQLMQTYEISDPQRDVLLRNLMKIEERQYYIKMIEELCLTTID